MNYRQSKKQLRTRAVIALLVTIVAGFGIGIIGLFNAGLIHGKEYRQRAESELISDTVISSARGTIYDADNNVLAQSTDAWKVYINPSIIEDDETAQAVARDLSDLIDDVEYSDIYMAAKKTSYAYLVVADKLDREQKDAVQKLREEKDGYYSIIGVEDDILRYYPYNNFASTVIGFTGSDDSGRAGLEYYYNTTLTGISGRSISTENARQDEMSADTNVYYEAEEGLNLRLTIDSAIQYYLDSALSSAVTEYKASYGYGVVMDVKTGKVLAMSSQPDYNCNKPYSVSVEETRKEIAKIEDATERAEAKSEALNAQWRNRTLTDTYEPGSVFKCITACAGIEEGVVSPDEMFVCTGSYKVADRTYHCSNTSGHGAEDFTTSLMNSCNPIYIEVAQRLGAETFYQYFDAFGFTEATGIDLPAEVTPKAGVTYYSLDNLNATALASSSFGQTFQTTPIQMLSAINAIANDGKVMQPYVVDGLLDKDGNVVQQTTPTVKRQAVSKITADIVTDMMVEVVRAGTASTAYVPGYNVAGKTGTSEKLTMGAGYYISSFAGFAPADDPEISIIIIVDEPEGSITGGAVAAPVGAEVISNVMRYLGVEPEYTDEEREEAELDVKTPNVTGIAAETAEEQLTEQGFTVEVIGKGDKVTRQMPEAGELIRQDGVIILYTDEDAKDEMVEVPTLTGRTVSSAIALAHENGLNIEILGDPRTSSSYKQSVAAGTEVAKGTTITLTYAKVTEEMEIEGR